MYKYATYPELCIRRKYGRLVWRERRGRDDNRYDLYDSRTHQLHRNHTVLPYFHMVRNNRMMCSWEQLIYKDLVVKRYEQLL